MGMAMAMAIKVEARLTSSKLYVLIQYIDGGQKCATCLPVPVVHLLGFKCSIVRNASLY